MHGIREFNTKINSLRNTLKITSSMKMVSTVKLQKYSREKQTATTFSQNVKNTLMKFTTINQPIINDILPEDNLSQKAIIVFFTSDRGLCGRYNANVFRLVLKLYEDLKQKNIQCSFCCSGQKAYVYLTRYNLQVEQFFRESAAHPNLVQATLIAQECLQKFYSGKADDLYLVYTKRVSSMLEEPVIEKLLPFPAAAPDEDQKKLTSDAVIVEASRKTCLKQMYGLKTLASVYQALTESAVSEHSARMCAMETASSNCDRLIQHYQQLRNRARQTAITTELSEIVTGKEALEK